MLRRLIDKRANGPNGHVCCAPMLGQLQRASPVASQAQRQFIAVCQMSLRSLPRYLEGRHRFLARCLVH
jgi:hypothetical protein